MERKHKFIVIAAYAIVGVLLAISVVGIRYPKVSWGVGGMLCLAASVGLLIITVRRASRGIMQWNNKQYSRRERPAAYWGLVLHHLFYVVMMGALGAVAIAALLGRLR
jgi:hypothetical protein